MNIITGYRGEPHITSSQDRAKNQGTFGTDSYILDVGQRLNAEIISANEIRIRDGVLSHQGCIANIEQGAYDSLEISNGSQGMQRRDLIVARYTKDAETNIEDISLVVIEGTPAASRPSDPPYNSGNIQTGDSPVDMPLYRVNINEITISSVTLLATKLMTQSESDTILKSIETTVTNARLDTWVDISSYNSESNMYTFPSDGYVFLNNSSGESGGGSLTGKNTSTVYCRFGYAQGRWSVFVKKGMKTYLYGNSSIYRFVPL